MRPIDADEVKKRFPIMENDFGMVINETLHKELDAIPPLEVIPKAEYETRLKADMVAMLTEIQLEIEEIPNSYEHKPIGTYDYCLGAEHERKVNLEIIQQKINALKAESEE